MTNSRPGRLATALTLALIIPALAAMPPQGTSAAVAAPTVSAPALVVGGVGNQMNPSLVGDTLIYDDCPLPYLPCTLSGYSFTTGESYQVATGIEYMDFATSVQRTDGSTVAWLDGSGQGMHLSTLSDNSIRDLPGTATGRREIAVWGNALVWTDSRNSKPASPSNTDIYMFDLSSGRELPISIHEFDATHPATNGKVIVWQDSRNGGSANFNTDIYGYDLATNKEFVIANTADSELTPAISGNTVVWVKRSVRNSSSIMGYDLQTKKIFTIATAAPPTAQGEFVILNDPAIWGNIVTWIKAEFPPGPGFPLTSGVYGYDLTSKQPFTVVDDDQAIRLSPTVSGKRIAWTEYSKANFADGHKDIMGATLDGVTSAPVEVPIPQPAPTSRTFPETGKTVEGRFLDYWLKHGALPQQGYPISEVMNEVSDLDGKTYSVQYFERAVFEKHPENKSPYDVLLSQLGMFIYKQKHPQPVRPNPTEGIIKGKLSYPSEGIPSLAIYAIPTDGSAKYYSIRTWSNSTEYAIEGVAPGTYYVVAYIAGLPNSALDLAYTKAAQCQQADPTASNCNDHALVPVTVASRQTVEGISPTDYSNEVKFPPQPSAGPEAGTCQTFEQTGRLVCGAFLQYWYAHGSLAQQGYPISTTLNEVSDLDGKTYSAQYFERAVFELHPENQPPYDVLLSQLGTFRYGEKYKP